MNHGKASIVDALNSLVENPPQKGGAQCRIAIVMDKLQEEERIALTTAIDAREVSLTRIAAILHEFGFPIGLDTVRRHRLRQRAGGCKCPRVISQTNSEN